MAKRIVIVGGVAAGASAAAKARRTSENVEIVMIEAGPYMSFANCGLPYYVGGEIPRRDGLFVASPKQFANRFRIDVRLNTEAIGVSRSGGTVTLRAADGQASSLHYDRLILATGAEPIIPPIAGLDCPNVFTCRTVPDVDAIAERIAHLLPAEREGAETEVIREMELHALIIGGGYIGLECAEQLMRLGFNITVVELTNQLMGPLDPEMAQPIQLALESAGAKVILRDGVARIERRGEATVAVLASGGEVPFDVAVLGTGVRPNVALAKSAGLKLGETGAIAADAMGRTSDPAIYAAGDNCEAVFLPTGTKVNIPLAGPANKQGRIAGANAALDLDGSPDDDARRLSLRGVLGTGIVRACGAVAGGTGLTEKFARKLGVECEVAYVPGPNHAGYYPGAEQMLVKVLYAPGDGRVLGAQAVGGGGVDKRIDVLSTAIYAGLTVEDLEQLDLAYAPPFGAAKDVVILAGYIAANARRGVSPGITPLELLDRLAGDHPPTVVDVRTAREYEAGHLPGAVNVPLDEVRDRLGDVPIDGQVVVHCSVGYRSYVAQQILRNAGRKDVVNLYGGYGVLSRAKKMT